MKINIKFVKQVIGILILVGLVVGLTPITNSVGASAQDDRWYKVPVPEYDKWYRVSDFDINFDHITFDPVDPQLVYATRSAQTTARGVFVSTDGGDHWSLLGLDCCSIVDLVVDPTNTQILYAAAAGLGDNYGVFKSVDKGQHWTLINNGFRDCPGGTCRVDCLAINPSNPNELYAGFWGVFRYTNGGETWEKRGLHFTYVHPIIIDPKDPATVYAGTDRAHGVYKFPSSGTDWVEMSNGFDKDALNIYALAIDPNNTQILYASNNKGLYKTTNGAQSWTKLPLEGTEYNLASIRSIAVDPKTSAVYIASTYGLAVEKSIDGGYTWVQLSNGLPRLDVNYVTVNPHDSRVLFASVSGEETYKMIQSAGAPNYPAKNLRAYPGNNKVALEWDAPSDTSNVSGYYVYRRSSVTNYSEPASDFPVKETKYVDENVENGKTYYYSVRAVHKDGTVSPPSNEVSAVPKAPTPPVVNIPDNAKATSSQYTFTGKVDPGSTVTVNGKQVSVDASGNFTAVVTLTSGTNTITIQVTNKAGDTVTIKKTVTYGSTTTPTNKMTIVLKIGDPYMTVNGAKKEIDPGRGTAPVIVKGRTLLPIRALIETMGGSVDWDANARKVTIKLKNTTIVLTIDKKQATVNGKVKEMDVAPQIINGRTMVPLRFVTEQLGCQVDWNADTKTVTIKY